MRASFRVRSVMSSWVETQPPFCIEAGSRHIRTPSFGASGATDPTNGRRGATGLGSRLRCSDIQQKVQSSAKIGFAFVQRRAHAQVTGRDVIQNDDVGANFLTAEGRFPGDGRFDQLHADLDALDQGHEVAFPCFLCPAVLLVR